MRGRPAPWCRRSGRCSRRRAGTSRRAGDSPDIEREQPQRLAGRHRAHVEARWRAPCPPGARGSAAGRRWRPPAGSRPRASARAAPGSAWQAAVERDAVLPHPHDGRRGVEVRDHPGGVPRRAAGELALVEQQRRRSSRAGEVVGDAAAGDAAADDDDAGLVLHAPLSHPLAARPGRISPGSRSECARPMTGAPERGQVRPRPPRPLQPPSRPGGAGRPEGPGPRPPGDAIGPVSARWPRGPGRSGPGSRARPATPRGPTRAAPSRWAPAGHPASAPWSRARRTTGGPR